MMPTLEEAQDIVNNAEIVNEGTPHAFVKGCYGNRYRDAITVLAEESAKIPCPPQLQREKTIVYKGYECRVYYNYVPPYNLGLVPPNTWFAYSEIDGSSWNCNGILKSVGSDELAETLEEAVSTIEPIFKAAVISRIWLLIGR